MNWYLLAVAAGTPLAAAYLWRGWKEFVKHREHFYAHHPMSHSVNYRLTDLWIAGIGAILLWPMERLDRLDPNNRTGMMLDNAFMWVARQLRKLKPHRTTCNGNHT